MVQKWLLPSLSEVLAQSTESGSNEPIVLEAGTSYGKERGDRSAANRKAKEWAKAQREWQSAIASLEYLLLQLLSQTDRDERASSLQGLLLVSPAPVLSHRKLLSRFQTGIFRSEPLLDLHCNQFQLPPGQESPSQEITNTPFNLPLFPTDPLTAEKFCLVFTSKFSLVMAAGEDLSGIPAFRFSFSPEDVEQAWISLYPRLLLTSAHQVSQLEALVKEFVPKSPDYRIVMEFGRQLLHNLPELPQAEKNHTLSVNLTTEVTQYSKYQFHGNEFGNIYGGRRDISKEGDTNRQPSQDRSTLRLPKDTTDRHWERLVKNDWPPREGKPKMGYESNLDLTDRRFSCYSSNRESHPDFELLQALTHEIRTPLTTIRTLTKLLLKRRDLPPEVTRRLEIIDHECTEQINRMELIFRAAELENTTAKQATVNLTSMSVAQIFQQSIPRWKKQAERRNLTLNVILPPNLPTVVSNPAMLDQVLTGLVENFTRTLPGGSHIQVEVTLAGNQLKLQLLSQTNSEDSRNADDFSRGNCRNLKSIGHLLMFQPETGSLCLNLNVTKHLFQALGGKLIVRQRPQEGEVMTIFLPLEVRGGVNYKTSR